MHVKFILFQDNLAERGLSPKTMHVIFSYINFYRRKITDAVILACHATGTRSLSATDYNNFRGIGIYELDWGIPIQSKNSDCDVDSFSVSSLSYLLLTPSPLVGRQDRKRSISSLRITILQCLQNRIHHSSHRHRHPAQK